MRQSSIGAAATGGAPGRRGDGAQIGGQIGGGEALSDGWLPPPAPGVRGSELSPSVNDPSSPIDARDGRRGRQRRGLAGTAPPPAPYCCQTDGSHAAHEGEPKIGDRSSGGVCVGDDSCDRVRATGGATGSGAEPLPPATPELPGLVAALSGCRAPIDTDLPRTIGGLSSSSSGGVDTLSTPASPGDVPGDPAERRGSDSVLDTLLPPRMGECQRTAEFRSG